MSPGLGGSRSSPCGHLLTRTAAARRRCAGRRHRDRERASGPARHGGAATGIYYFRASGFLPDPPGWEWVTSGPWGILETIVGTLRYQQKLGAV